MSLGQIERTESLELLETARERFRDGDYRVAESILQQIISQVQDRPDAFNMLAAMAYDRGQFSKAIRLFQRALEIDPGHTDSSVGLSILLNDLGRYDEAKQVYENAQAQLANEGAKNNPYLNERLANKHIEIGELYFQSKNYAEAIKHFEQALPSLGRDRTRTLDVKMKIVECQHKNAGAQRAFEMLVEVIRENPDFVPARIKLGLLYYGAKMNIEAIEQWEFALSLDPRNQQAIKYLQIAQHSATTALR